MWGVRSGTFSGCIWDAFGEGFPHFPVLKVDTSQKQNVPVSVPWMAYDGYDGGMDGNGSHLRLSV